MSKPDNLFNSVSMELVEVKSKRDKARFIDFPHDLYAGDPNYVPEIYIGQQEMLDEKKNPFFQHSQAKLFLALRNGQVIGRIAAIRNNEYNRFADANVGYFGFFDVVEDYEVARQLLDTACHWIKQQGLDGAIGPANFTTNDVAGLLVEGFDTPPVVMMSYNKPYYAAFLERYGFTKKMDLFAYLGKTAEADLKSVRLSKMLEERLLKRGISFRNLDMKHFNREIVAVRQVYKSAWDKNWGFVPPTDAEFDRLAKEMKMIIDPDFALMAEHEGRLIAFALAVPDVNVITRTINRGRLLPTGIFKLLFLRKRIKRVRVILLGVTEPYRKLGIEGIFYARIISRAKEKGYTEGEASWILESNDMMRRGVESINMFPYKRYRMYEKSL
jgi:GNAT superfamily N-acetyltransferase